MEGVRLFFIIICGMDWVIYYKKNIILEFSQTKHYHVIKEILIFDMKERKYHVKLNRKYLIYFKKYAEKYMNLLYNNR